MNVNNMLEKINKIAKARELEEEQEAGKKSDRFTDKFQEAWKMRDRVDNLITILKELYDKKLLKKDYSCHTTTTLFVAEYWLHKIGYSEHNGGEIAIFGGGCCHYNLEFARNRLIVNGSDGEYVLDRFIKEFPVLEQQVIEYVDNLFFFVNNQ